MLSYSTWGYGGTGIHNRLKICRLLRLGGSSPPIPTIYISYYLHKEVIIMKSHSQTLYKALISSYKAQRDEARAILEVYFNNSVGVAEHSGLLGEMQNWAIKLSEAEEVIEALERNFKMPPPVPGKAKIKG